MQIYCLLFIYNAFASCIKLNKCFLAITRTFLYYIRQIYKSLIYSSRASIWYMNQLYRTHHKPRPGKIPAPSNPNTTHLGGPCDVILTSLRNFCFFDVIRSADRCIIPINDFKDTKNNESYPFQFLGIFFKIFHAIM